jgi:hypothetical protein
MRRIAIASLAWFGLAGCDRVFLGDRPIGRIEISLVRERAYVTHSVEVHPLDATDVRASVLVHVADEPGGFLERPMRADADGVFHATVIEGDRLVKVEVPGEPTVLYALEATDLVLRDSVYGRPDPDPAPPNAQLELEVALDRPYDAGRFELRTVGAWAHRSLTVPEQPPFNATTWTPPPIAFASLTTPEGGPAQRLRSDDRVLLLRYDATGVLDGLLSLPGYEQTDGVHHLAAPMTALTPTSHLFEIDPRTTAARLLVVRPAPVLSWSVSAAPGASVARADGPVLASQIVLESSSHAIATFYPEPFAGWPSVVSWSATGVRGTTGPAEIPIHARLFEAVELPSNPSPGDPLKLTQPQGLPLLVSLEGTPLVADGAAITFDHEQPVMLEMTVDRAPPACDRHGFTLVSVDPATGTRTSQFTAFSTTPSVTMPGRLFSSDRVYLVQATCEVGVRELAQGITASSLPYGVGVLDSAVFTTP